MSLTIEQLLKDESLRREEFPVVREKVFLGHAGVCPLPERVAGVMQGALKAATAGSQESGESVEQIEATRRLAADLIGADPTEVAFVGPTSLALSLIASGVSFQPGENVVIYFDDYPSNVYPWLALREKGVEVRCMETPELGRVGLPEVRRCVDERTRLVALASCHFISGWRADIDAIGRFLKERNILFSVDGIQTLGAFPFSVAHVDFLAADSHKWMLGPCGAGILYVRKGLQEALRPPIYGWHNVWSPGFVAQEKMVLRPDARRYEAGTYHLVEQVGLHAALSLLLEVGVDSIGRELQRKRDWLIPALQGRGFTVLAADAPPENASGIISFYREGTDPAELARRLEQEGILVSVRVDRQGRHYLRLSPHFYNTDAELNQVLEALPAP